MFTHKDLIPIPMRRMAAARHEAGHVLVAIHFGDPVAGAVLHGPDGLSGEMQYVPGTPSETIDPRIPDQRQRVADRISTVYAGNVAELAYWTEMKGLFNPRIDSHRTDLAMIERLSTVFGAGKREQNLAKCRGKAQSILNSPSARAALAEIAQWLAQHRSIDRPQIDAILAKHSFS